MYRYRELTKLGIEVALWVGVGYLAMVGTLHTIAWLVTEVL